MTHTFHSPTKRTQLTPATKDNSSSLTTHWLVLNMLLLVTLLAGGCSSYHLTGTVIEGPQSAVLVVSKNDPRLNQPGVNSASLMFTLDPESLNAKTMPMDISDGGGRFSTPVSETGAGFLEYELLVICRAAGYDTATRKMKLPGGNKRLLIIMSAGADSYKPKRDIVNETIDMGHKLTPGQ